MRGAILRPLLATAVMFAIGAFFASVVVVFALAYLFLFPGSVPLALYFGVALGASSGAVVIPLANRMGLQPALRGLEYPLRI